MKNMVPIFFALIALIVVACGFTKLDGTKNIICDQVYALCTSAQCIPDPNNSNESICFCEVRKGKSLGHTPCNKRVPTTDQQGIEHVISTFSFDDFATKENMTCSSGMPWSDCLDQPCTVDPLDPSKAICICTIVRTGAFQTFGGNCDRSTCDKGYWSGATVEANSVSVQALMKALGLSESPQRFCSE